MEEEEIEGEEVVERRKEIGQKETKEGSKIPAALVLALLLGAIAGALAGLAVQALFVEEEEDTPIAIDDEKVGIGTDEPATELDVDGVITAEGGNSNEWNQAADDALKWDGGDAGLDPVAGCTSLGLGTLAMKDTINNTDWNGTELAVDHGGTGATNTGDARTNLGLVSGGVGDIWVDTSGDTMTGILNLPADGLTAGSNQLVLSGGNVGIGTISPDAKLHMENGGLLITGTSGSTPVSEGGTRLMWIPEKSAFRAGTIDGNQWDDANIGYYSSAMGYNTTAEGNYSTAFGYNTTARGYCSTSMGWDTIVTGDYSIAMGRGSSASGYASTAIGYLTDASGGYSTAMGRETITTGNYSTAMGYKTKAFGYYSTAMGRYTNASGYASTALGCSNTASGRYSTAIGHSMSVEGNYSVGIGLNFRLFGPWKITQDNTMAIMGGRVGIGTVSPNTELDVDGTVTATEFQDSTPVAFHVYNSLNHSYSSAGMKIVDFGIEVFDYGNNYNSVTDTFTAPTNGVYQFNAMVTAFGIDSGNRMYLAIYKNGVHYKNLERRCTHSSSQFPGLSGSVTMQLNAGDTIQVGFYVGNDTSWYILGSSKDTIFSGHRVA